ncbi:MAG: hypothetical protein RI591_03760 [Dehalococcoidia bacterium]|nr:hypothetical protein [Dehalococcoidia bacterium]
MALSPAVALAGPPSPPDYGKYNPTDQPGQPPEEWGVEKVIPSPSAPGGAVRIITDPLEGTSLASGWITFWCQSRLGLKYNIGATGLNPVSTYGVKADGVQIQIVQAGEGVVPFEIEPGLWVDLATLTPVPELDLGMFHTDANGRGGVRGVVKLEAGYVYDVVTSISDTDGTPVLWSPSNDTNGFIVY